MSFIGEYFIYNDPIKIIWRKGTPDDPYVDKIDNLVIIDSRTVLNEIPDEFHRVQIEGYTELIQNTHNSQKRPTENEFIVNYQNGVITFHESKNGETVVATYKGRGIVQYPAERIYVHSPNPYAVENLQQFIEFTERKIGELNEVIGNAKKATNEAIEATEETRIATDLAYQAIDKADQATYEAQQATEDAIEATYDALDATALALDAKDQAILARNQSILIWQNPVPVFSELFPTYPNPEIGWTVITETDGVVYRWSGVQWVAIGNITGTVPLASETTSGLMSVPNFIKLRDIEEGAEVNFRGEDAKEVLPDDMKIRTLVFVIPDEIKTGTQGIILPFPYDGEIVGINASCGQAGADNTVIEVQKISKDNFVAGGIWSNILSNNLVFNYGERIDDGTVIIEDVVVNKDDLFRINIVTAGYSIKDLTVQIHIKC